MSKDFKTVVAFFKNNMVGSGSGEVIDAIVIEIAKQLKSGEVILVDMGSQDKTYGHLLEDANWLCKQGVLSKVYKEEDYEKLNKELEGKVELDFTSGLKHFELYPKVEKKTKPFDTTENVSILERWGKTPVVENLFLGEENENK